MSANNNWLKTRDSLNRVIETFPCTSEKVIPIKPSAIFVDKVWCKKSLLSSKVILSMILGIIFTGCYIWLLDGIINEAQQRSLDSSFKGTRYNSILDGSVKEGSHSNPWARVVRVEIRILSVDLNQNKIQAHISLFPSVTLAQFHGRINTNILAYMGYFQKIYETNSTMSPLEVTFPILSGTTSYYPFDEFTAEIAIEFIELSTNRRLPTQVSLQAHHPSLLFLITRTTESYGQQLNTTETEVRDKGEDYDVVTKYKYHLDIRRPASVKLFSCMVVIIMWLLTMMMMGITSHITILSINRPAATYLAVSSALLFALPNLRSTQPGVPPIGIIIDALGFFWNMIIIGTCSILISLTWMFRRKATTIII